ncbi:LacI family DNA-binding transcriptional regulator [Oceanobacillus neutriphilus]|uniref:LacI family transcriptional regulator n=1 Tax=Oceanobacillus neutriphilus TaxID=531815 RepID=A0ABQ2NPA7_9BACI|nr:LacI family DNA-binding transcriptional regulator [Oceanobacillus neutriphilus]GGP07849.1 LacI family transcriptional regulator [Oceanobacillus neutriphilus]
MATIKDVAKLAGVAVSTASYALNNSNKVSDHTRIKVLNAAKELNYQKNGIAADLKMAKTNTIALILGDLSGPYYSELIQGVQNGCSANNYGLIACSAIGGSQSTAVKFLREKRVDGAIILAQNISDDVILEAARDGFPLVVLDREMKHTNIQSVLVDNVHGGYLATEYLINQGHKEIIFVSGPNNSLDNQLRFEGYLKALKEYQINFQPVWKVPGNFTRESGYKATKTILAQNNLPDSIFYANDEMAIGGLQAFNENGIKVPGDVSIIGYDDIEISEYVNPPLTTIKQPKYETGSLAIQLIFQLLRGEKINHLYKLNTELVVRSSV